MVKIFSKSEHALIDDALKQADARTSAEIFLVVAPASDPYQNIMMVFGFVSASAATLVLSLLVSRVPQLWQMGLTGVLASVLLAQLAAMGLCAFAPPVRALLTRLVPKRIKHYRAAHKAGEEYLKFIHGRGPEAPAVLLFISLAERYAHVLASPAVHKTISNDHWIHVIDVLTKTIRTDGLVRACAGAADTLAGILSSPFPPHGAVPAHGRLHEIAEPR